MDKLRSLFAEAIAHVATIAGEDFANEVKADIDAIHAKVAAKVEAAAAEQGETSTGTAEAAPAAEGDASEA